MGDGKSKHEMEKDKREKNDGLEGREENTNGGRRADK
jgi:hypothetical protein